MCGTCHNIAVVETAEMPSEIAFLVSCYEDRVRLQLTLRGRQVDGHVGGLLINCDEIIRLCDSFLKSKLADAYVLKIESLVVMLHFNDALLIVRKLEEEGDPRAEGMERQVGMARKAHKERAEKERDEQTEPQRKKK